MIRQVLTTLAGALLLTVAGPLTAQDTPPQPDNVEASAGDFKIIHLWTTDPEGFMTAWQGPTPPNVIGLARAGVGLIIEDGEQLGRYRVALAVTDHNSGAVATSIVHLEAIEEGTLTDAQ